MGSNKIFEATLRAAERRHALKPLEDHLDIGAGAGDLIRLFRERFGTQSRACDCTTDRMKLADQGIELVDLNVEKKLPYPDESFDVVTGTELVEHLQDYRAIIREIHRVMRPGGICVLSTPNVLNLNSRLRNLFFGFPVLFGPLPVGDRSLGSTAGHITPIPYFYLAHAMMEADFIEVNLDFDKPQRSGRLKLLFWYLPIRILGALAWRREVSRYKTIGRDNEGLVRAMNSTPMLLGRTIVVSGVKAG